MKQDDSRARAALREMSLRTQNLIQRGVVDTVDDALMLQYMDVSTRAGSKPKKVEKFQQYGFTAVPHGGASEALVVNLGGSPDHPIVIATDDRRYRMKAMKGGEVAIYDDLGQSVMLGRDTIKVTSPTKVVVECPDINLGGEGGKPVAIQGTLDDQNHALVSNFSTTVKAV